MELQFEILLGPPFLTLLSVQTADGERERKRMKRVCELVSLYCAGIEFRI